MNPTLDPTVVNLARAIRQTESGGNFNAKGKSGEHGAYQFTPDTWKATAPKYGITVPIEQATPEQQNAVAYNRIKAWKDAGHDVTQIASMWNAGENEPDAYTGRFSNGGASTGVNKFGARFDVPTYAKSVASAYLSLKNGENVGTDPNNPSSIDNNTPLTTPPGVQPNPSGTGTNDQGLPNFKLSGGGMNDGDTGGSTAMTTDQSTVNDVVNVGKGLVSGTIESGKDIAAAIGGNAMAKTFEALPKADQDYLSTLIQLRNKAAGAKNKDEVAHFQGLIKNYKTSDGQSITDVFPALNKSAEQVLGDFASMALETIGSAEGAQGLGELSGLAAKTGTEGAVESFGKRLLKSSATGAGYGAGFGASGAMQNNAGLGDIAESAAIGAGTGAVVGGGTSLAGEGLSKAFGKSLSPEEIGKVKPEDVKKLSLKEQKEWHTQNAKRSTDLAKQAGEKSVEEAKAKISKTSQQLADMNEQKRVALKEPFKQTMRDMSQEYVTLTGEAVKDNPALTKTISSENLGGKIDSKFENDPELGAEIKKDLGIGGEDKDLTNQEILDKAREIMANVSSAAKAGGRTYTSDEYMAMKKYSFLMETLGDNGVDMSQANKFWREWAPVRERGVKAIQPFDDSNVKKGNLSSTLNKAAVTPTTPAQAVSKLEAKNFISELETRLKLPKGSLGKDAETMMQEIEKAKLTKANARKVAADVAKQIREASRQEKWKLQDKAERNKRIGTFIKYALGALGITAGGKFIEPILHK